MISRFCATLSATGCSMLLARHDSFIHVTWLIHTRDVTHSYTTRDLTHTPIHIITHTNTHHHTHQYTLSHTPIHIITHTSFTCVPWRFFSVACFLWLVTRSNMQTDSFLRVLSLMTHTPSWTQHSMQHTTPHCNTLQHTKTHCDTLRHTATYCNILQRTATYCNILHLWGKGARHTKINVCKAWSTLHCNRLATHWNTVQHTATHCNALQHTATYCNTLQHM